MNQDRVRLFKLRSYTQEDWALLDELEKARADRIVVESKRNQAIVGRAVMRRVLAAELNQIAEQAGSKNRVRASEVSFQVGEYGKPELSAGPPLLRFNLSHSGELAVLITSAKDIRVGIDVEFRRPARRFEAIAENFFSEREYLKFQQLDDSQHEECFYRLWTGKEAYLKALGTGLSFSSRRFSFEGWEKDKSLAGLNLIDTEWPKDHPDNWHVEALDLDSTLPLESGLRGSYAGALCRELESPREGHSLREKAGVEDASQVQIIYGESGLEE